MQVAIKVLTIIGTVLTVLQAYQILYFIGIFGRKTYKISENKHKYAICIAARNEEKVIKNLLESINVQNYPKDKLTIFVVADNCNDKTVDVVKAYAVQAEIKIICYQHKNPNERTKGFALRYLFEKIKEDFSIEAFDGYFVFDADNVLNKDYVSRMNDAFDAGNKIITSFRNSKNFGQNWISYSYAIHWLRTCLLEHRGKTLLNLSCRIQGTGFLFTNEIVKEGWKYTSLTEDRAFCSDAVVKGYKVVYCEDAKFYDEQPYELKVALRQRLRWAKGHLQSTTENCPKLAKNTFKFNKNSIRSYDCFWMNFPVSVESIIRRIIIWTLQIIVGIIAANFWGVIWGICIGLLTGMAGRIVTQVVCATVVSVYYRKIIPKVNIWKCIFYIFMFPLFDAIGRWSSYVAVFKRVEWKPIKHDYVVDVNKLTSIQEKDENIVKENHG